MFNLNKGSIPVRLNMNMAKFDDCAKLSSKDFVDTAKTGGLVPSVAHGMAISPATEGSPQGTGQIAQVVRGRQQPATGHVQQSFIAHLGQQRREAKAADSHGQQESQQPGHSYRQRARGSLHTGKRRGEKTHDAEPC